MVQEASDILESNTNVNNDGESAQEENSIIKANTKIDSPKKRKHLDKTTKCQHCEQELPKGRKKYTHEKSCAKRSSTTGSNNDSEVDKFICEICPETFKFESGLTRHAQKHLPPGGFFCKICDLQFTNEVDRTLHRKTCHKKFKCTVCATRFENQDEYQSHIREVHDGKYRELFVCTICGTQYRTQIQLKQHNDSNCGTIKCFKCEDCGLKYMTQNALNAHRMIHVGEKKHLCGYCGTSFLSKGQLKVHERSHSGEKPFVCDVCDKSFAYRESLVTHSSVHTGIKPYICECCANRFSCIGNLIKHRRSRPTTCGLPQYNKNTKVAPRASAKIAGSFTMKAPQKLPREPYGPRKSLKLPTVKKESDVKSTMYENSNIQSSEYEEIIDVQSQEENIIIEEPDYEHEKQYLLVIEPTDAMQIESNIEIEYISTNGEVIPQEQQPQPMEQPALTHANIDEQFEINFVNDIGATIADDHDYEAAADTWGGDNESMYSNEQEQVDDAITYEPYVGKFHDSPDVLQEDIVEEILPDDCIYDNKSRLAVEKQETNELIAILEDKLTPNIPEMELNTEEEYLIYDKDEEDQVEDKPSIKNRNTFTTTTLTYQCPNCPKQYSHRKPYMKHLHTEHNIVEIKGTAIANIDENHNDSDDEDAKQPSDLINNLLAKHEPAYEDSTNTLVYKCSCCRTWYTSMEECEQHQIEEHKDKLYCEPCNKIYADPGAMSAHYRYKHRPALVIEPVKPRVIKRYCFVCSKCGKNFTSKVALTDHERGDCGNSPIYKCNICDKAYHSAGSLKTHQTLHTGELPHLCNFCGKAFRTQGQVKVHERRHNGEKPYKCSYCPKSFAHRESLLTHVSLHTGLKRFLCQSCDRRFSCISNLQAHRKTHKACAKMPKMTKAVGPTGFDKTNIKAQK